jgi:hypothetical protein
LAIGNLPLNNTAPLYTVKLFSAFDQMAPPQLFKPVFLANAAIFWM